MATARAILDRGDVVLMFPEGTRIRPGSLGRPRRGVGRLALETGAPVVPVAVIGTEAVRRGWRIRPHKVRIRAGRALTFPKVERPSPALAGAVTDRIWPCVELQWEWLGGLPRLHRAAVIGAGAWGTGLAVALARAGLEVDLGAANAEAAARIGRTGRNDADLPGVSLPDGVNAVPAARIELEHHDLVVLAVPAHALPATVGAHGGSHPRARRRPRRSPGGSSRPRTRCRRRTSPSACGRARSAASPARAPSAPSPRAPRSSPPPRTSRSLRRSPPSCGPPAST